jgi:hypothetical protein
MELDTTSLMMFIGAMGVVLTTSLLKMSEMAKRTKTAIATFVSIVASGLVVWMSGDVDASDLMPTVLQIFGGSQIVYRFVLDGTSVDERLEAVGSHADDDA